MDKRTFLTLDSLRGVAAFAVVFWHAGPSLAGPLFPADGNVAVDLFFVMSGFVLAYAYEDQFRGGLTPLTFVKIRLIRLYPLYLCGTLVGICLALFRIGRPFVTSSAFLSILMLPTPSEMKGAFLYPYNTVAWSLLAEIIVNVAYAFTWKRWTISNIVILISFSAALIIAASFIHPARDANFGFTWRNFPGGIARVFYGFPAGVLIYRLWKRYPLPRAPSFILVFVAPLFLLGWRPSGAIVVVYDLVAVLIMMPAIIIFAVSVEPPPLLQKAAAALGVASYAIYAIHFPLIDFLSRTKPYWVTRLAPLPLLFLSVFILLSAILLDDIYDRPIRRCLSAVFLRSGQKRGRYIEILENGESRDQNTRGTY